jgi:O-antigen ligase
LQTTEEIVYQPPWFFNGRLVFGTIAVVLVSWFIAVQFGLPGALSFVLAVQITLFLFLFHRPVYAMASLLVGQFTASAYLIPLSDTQTISVRFIWTVLTILLLIPVLGQKGGIKLGKRARRIIIPAIAFFAIATLSNMINANMSIAFQYLRNFSTALVILVLLPASVKNEKDVKRLALVALITCAVSGIIAVMQHYSFRGAPVITLYNNPNIQGRMPGLSDSAVNLAFDLPIVILPAAAIYFCRGVGLWSRRIIALLILIMTAALFFTYTRSGMYALAPGLLVLIFLAKGKSKKEMLLVALVLVVFFVYYVTLKGNRYSQGFSEEESAAGRLVLWQAGAQIALSSPILGIGEGKFQDVSVSYLTSAENNNNLLQTQQAVGLLSSNPVHNDFIRVWLAYGTPALILYLWFFVVIFLNFLEAYRRSDTRFLKGFTIGCIGAIAAYIVNAATHNLMDSAYFLWIFGGLSIAVTKLTQHKPSPKIKETS